MNILYILLDQIRKDMLGAYGHQIVKTPNIDRLAKRLHTRLCLRPCTYLALYRLDAFHTRHYS